MDAALCNLSRFTFVNVFRIQVSVPHTASPTTGRLMAIIRRLTASAILFWGIRRETQSRGKRREPQIRFDRKKRGLLFFATLCGLCVSALNRIYSIKPRINTDEHGWEKEFQPRKRVHQSVRPTGFAEETFGLVLIRVHLCPSVVKRFSTAWVRRSGRLTLWRDAIRRGLLPGRWPAQPSRLRSSPNRC